MLSSFVTAIFAVATGLIAPITASPTGAIMHSLKADIGAMACGNFATAAKRDLMLLQYDLRAGNGNSTIPGHACRRISCHNTSGIYACNDNQDDVTIPDPTIADFASNVGADCCKSDATKSKGLSGQAFSKDGWNVGVAFANCNHNNMEPPSIFDPRPPGINGECKD